MNDPRVILLATTNSGKLAEARAFLSDLPVRWLSLHDVASLPEPVEDADSFEGNARIKALHYAKLADGWALADDSGLEVDALDGAPGVHSSRFAGPARDVRANNAKLVAALADVAPDRRTARFRCVVALANPSGVIATARGTLEGLIVDDARGEHGFGYDPHFLVPELGLTTAQMSPKQKNHISHRGRALRSIRPHLEQLLAPEPPAR